MALHSFSGFNPGQVMLPSMIQQAIGPEFTAALTGSPTQASPLTSSPFQSMAFTGLGTGPTTSPLNTFSGSLGSTAGLTQQAGPEQMLMLLLQTLQMLLSSANKR